MQEEKKAGSFGITHSSTGQIPEPVESYIPIKRSVSGGIPILLGAALGSDDFEGWFVYNKTRSL